ncbi:MauE/DoxX family redox-associated membrane protein [Flavobacterium phragmitis]|uniref:Methylamine utilisation protein MauE n=1 Tax=Flavobacterium phragmitis TaxID=739143 RepID=A0A1I1LJ53_9FLAO|nr:MauE/DoxX family redox-associated membrane protein [Flavobacterium phragmitis]SFC72592.1 Methylamine utilisation protein MauE [Flavobacterium phragmitis]
MKLQVSLKNTFVETTSLLFVLLFTYAAITKLLDFENFQVQLGQSPLLSSYAIWISYMVIAIELLISLMLMIPKFRTAGLYASLSLMSMFSSYIFIMLHFSSFVPCSCGGILEKMSWNVHLIFNLFFVGLALASLLMLPSSKTTNGNQTNRKKRWFYISSNIIFSIIIVIVLFLSSEKIMHYKNPFIRRFPKHPIVQDTIIDLKYNSYYFAGSDREKIYLGNYSNPLHITAIGKKTKERESIKIIFDSKKILFSSVKIRIRDSSFYLMDGTVPAVFTGSKSDWKANRQLTGMPYFTLAEPINPTKIILRSSNGRNAEHSIGIFDETRSSKIKYNSRLLQKQIDGIFDTDGTLLFDEKANRTVYTYYYRNQYIVIDSNGNLEYSANTIDTTTKAKIKVAHLKNNTQRKLSAPALTVNAYTAVCENLLFVNSKVSGRFESDKLWEQSFIIDVYDLNTKSYLMSFSIYKIDNKKMSSFFVTSDYLYAIMGTNLGIYRLRDLLKNEINSVKSKEK